MTFEIFCCRGIPIGADRDPSPDKGRYENQIVFKPSRGCLLDADLHPWQDHTGSGTGCDDDAGDRQHDGAANDWSRSRDERD